MSINVHIRRIFIDDIGVGHDQLNSLKSATRFELERQIKAQGLRPELRPGYQNKRVDGGRISVNSAEPASLGAQVGRAIFRGISK